MGAGGAQPTKTSNDTGVVNPQHYIGISPAPAMQAHGSGNAFAPARTLEPVARDTTALLTSPVVYSQSSPFAIIYPLEWNSDGSVKGGLPGVSRALLTNNPGMCVGDEHTNKNVMKTIQKLLPVWKDLGVTLIYVEAVKAEDQAVLDKFNNDGDTKALKDYFLQTGRIVENFGVAAVDRYVAMMAKAKENGIKLSALDGNISGVGLHFSNEDVLKDKNPYWTQRIESSSEKGKYVILGGAMHCENFSSVLGVSARLHIPSLTPYHSQLHGTLQIKPGQVIPHPNKKNGDFVFGPLRSGSKL